MTNPADAPSTTQLESPSANPAINAEAGAGWLDWAVVAAVVAVALWYLYRKLWANRGECGGCAKGKGGCAVLQASRRAQVEHRTQGPMDHLER